MDTITALKRNNPVPQPSARKPSIFLAAAPDADMALLPANSSRGSSSSSI
ncbi:MAG: hypothetical protein M9895_08945 [Aquamicrobium sp.]|nr:hypothetical protein [Aquamicrobium sp.]